MAQEIAINAEFREGTGRSSSRRMRRVEERVPGVLYGAALDPVLFSVEARALSKAMEEEAFFSQILTLKVGDATQKVILRDLQRHPATERVLHIDLQRIREDTELQLSVPLHFINEDICVGVRLDEGLISRNLIEVEISCLPKDLPEFIEVDLEHIGVGQSVHLSDLTLPEGVSIVALSYGEERDVPVVSVQIPRGGLEDEFEEEVEDLEADEEGEETDAAPEEGEDDADADTE